MSVWGERAADWGYAAGWNLTQITPDLLARAIFDVGAMAGARKGDLSSCARTSRGCWMYTPGGARPAHHRLDAFLRTVLARGVPAALAEHGASRRPPG